MYLTMQNIHIDTCSTSQKFVQLLWINLIAVLLDCSFDNQSLIFLPKTLSINFDLKRELGLMIYFIFANLADGNTWEHKSQLYERPDSFFMLQCCLWSKLEFCKIRHPIESLDKDRAYNWKKSTYCTFLVWRNIMHLL